MDIFKGVGASVFAKQREREIMGMRGKKNAQKGTGRVFALAVVMSSGCRLCMARRLVLITRQDRVHTEVRLHGNLVWHTA